MTINDQISSPHTLITQRGPSREELELNRDCVDGKWSVMEASVVGALNSGSIVNS